MLTALTVALLSAAGLAWACWRLRRALTAAHAEHRITQAAVARDQAAHITHLMDGIRRYRNEQAVLAAADAVITTALTQHARNRNGEPQ